MDLTKSKILITGGAGFVGSHIADRLIKEGAGQIVVIDNFARGSMDNLQWAIEHGNVAVIKGDVSDGRLVDSAMQGVDYIFHKAALRITECAQKPREAFKTLFEGTYNVLEYAVKAKVKKIILASSASVYGEPNYLPIDERHAFNNYTLYGAGKITGEYLLRAFFDMYRLNYLTLRYFNIYGPRMDIFGVYTEVLIKWLDCIDSHKAPVIYGDGTAAMDFVYIDDVVEANIQALKSDITNQVFNVGTGREVSLNELLSIILAVTGSNVKPEYRPARTVNPVKKRRADTKKAKEILGFQANVPLEEGIRKLIDWRKNILINR